MVFASTDTLNHRSFQAIARLVRQRPPAAHLSKPSAAQLPGSAIWPFGNLNLCSSETAAGTGSNTFGGQGQQSNRVGRGLTAENPLCLPTSNLLQGEAHRWV